MDDARARTLAATGAHPWRAPACLLWLALSVACGGAPPAPGAVDLTVLDRLTFEPMPRAAVLHYGPSFQGGDWAMPAIRESGAGIEGLIRAEISGGAGEIVGAALAQRVRFTVEPDGAGRLGWLAIAMVGEQDGSSPPASLSGTEANLHVAYTDEGGRAGDVSWPITLVAWTSP